ncbi:ZIP family metal transporter [Patescibacteria group bacterium]|nr:ZIP family metal transporter [Patescibacteria group bacterium]MBU1682911.1 ZIP family metal transporter [Patescibacteria group bacterium]MBU1935141.1 ZIP family metal transporter [Patescibacteria group bacterium]
MSQVWLYTLVSVLIVSLVSLVGILIVILKQKSVKKFLLFMVSFAAGAMLGDVFVHLLPELIDGGHFNLMTSVYILCGILLFFVLEKIIHWRHCHHAAVKDHIHPLAFMNLVGDAVHNFIDGILIAGSFMLSIPVGIATTVAVILHEIPQEMGDFGVLLHSGMKAKKALMFNFLTALTAVLGALVILGLGIDDHDVVQVIIPFTIGGFLYIANADLIPELHKDVKVKNSVIQLISFLIGVAIMFLLLFLPTHGHDSNIDGGDIIGEHNSVIEEVH